jgi:lipopolysaccharide export system protein LptC
VTTIRTDPATAHAYWTMGRADGDRAFRAARRHSRAVRILRVAIPIAVVLGSTGIFLVTYFNPLRILAKLPIDIGSLVVSGSKITMEHPRVSGFTSDARAYEFSADAAKQDLTKPDLIELRNIRAKVQMQDKSTMDMSAATGIYDSKGETLKLDQNIVLSSTSGYRGRLSDAMVDIHKGNVVSERPVEVELLQGTLNANRLEIVDSGDLVRFDGGVKMTVMLNGAAPPRAKPGEQ